MVHTWSKPSPGGTRLALQRKFELNAEAYGGALSVLTVTGLGADVLPFDTDVCEQAGVHKCSGKLGCRVEWIYAEYFNRTAQARMSRLFEAAMVSADRWVRHQWAGPLPRQFGNVAAYQDRGVLHYHYGLPQGTEIERVWSRHVRKFIERQVKLEAQLPREVVWAAVEREYVTGEVTRGVYGFGFVHPGRRNQATESAARYLARNAASYLAGNVGGTRHYVSSRLTGATGITMAALRSCNYLYVRRKLGEVDVVPLWWSTGKQESVLRVWALIENRGPPVASG